MRPERLGLKVAEVLAEAGDTVTAGQTLARLNLPEGGSINVQAPVAGIISVSNAMIGAIASGKGEALFNIIARNEYDLVGLVPTADLAQARGQPAGHRARHRRAATSRARCAASRRPSSPPCSSGRSSSASPPTGALLVNAAARALIKTGQSCNVAVPLTAVQYGSAGTVVQVVKRAAHRDQARRDRADVAAARSKSATASTKARMSSPAPARCCAKAIRCGR